MAVHRTNPVQFRIQMIGKEIRTSADSSTPLSQVAQENGITPQPNFDLLYYHNGQLVNPYYSLAALQINNDDIIYCLLHKKEKKLPLRSAQISPLTFSPDYFRHTTSASTSTQFFEDDLISSLPQPQRAKTRPVIIPPPPLAVSRDPLPMAFPNDDPQENASFWKSIERRFSVDG